MVHLAHLYLNSLAVQVIQEAMPKALLQSHYITSTLRVHRASFTQGKQADFETLRARTVHLVTNSILNTEGPIQQKVHAKQPETGVKTYANESCYILINILLLKLKQIHAQRKEGPFKHKSY